MTVFALSTKTSVSGAADASWFQPSSATLRVQDEKRESGFASAPRPLCGLVAGQGGGSVSGKRSGSMVSGVLRRGGQWLNSTRQRAPTLEAPGLMLFAAHNVSCKIHPFPKLQLIQR